MTPLKQFDAELLELYFWFEIDHDYLKHLEGINYLIKMLNAARVICKHEEVKSIISSNFNYRRCEECGTVLLNNEICYDSIADSVQIVENKGTVSLDN